MGVALIDPNMPDLGLTLNFTGGNLCNNVEKYQLLIQLNCDNYASTTTYSIDTASLVDPCRPRIIF